MAAVGGTLLARMTYLAVFEGEKYRLASEDNRVSLRLIPPRRGWIVDRAGLPLASNAPDYRVELIPEQVTDLEATLHAVGAVLPLSPEELARIHAEIVRQPKYMPVELAHGLAWRDFATLNIRLPDLPGLVPVAGFSRTYPGGEAFAHLLGYVGSPSPAQYQVEHDPLLIFPGLQARQGRYRAHPGRAAARHCRRPPRRGQRSRPGDPRPRHPQRHARQDHTPDHRQGVAGLCRAPHRRRFPPASSSWTARPATFCAWSRCRPTTPTSSRPGCPPTCGSRCRRATTIRCSTRARWASTRPARPSR